MPKGQVAWNKGKKLLDNHKKHLKEAKRKFFENGGKSWNDGKPYYKIRGKNHYNWQGGISSENRIMRKRDEFLNNSR